MSIDVLQVLDEAIREAYRAMPTPLNHRGESTRRIEHHSDYIGELRQARAAVAELIESIASIRLRASLAEADGVNMRGALRNIIEQADAALAACKESSHG